MRTIIFDLDGTLADTGRDLIEAANTCFRARGLGDLLDPDKDCATAFQGGRAMLQLGFARAQAGLGTDAVDADYPRLLSAYEAGIDRHTRMYPGAVAAIEGLKADGCAIAICTNKPEGLADLLMRRLGVRHLFAALVGADTLPVRKPDPEPLRVAAAWAGGELGRSMLVGDTVTDRETARAAGVPCALVTFGPSGDRIAELAPEGLLGHYDELPGLVRRLLG